MRLEMRIPDVRPDALMLPAVCPYQGCGGGHFELHGTVRKRLRDTRYQEVLVHRYRCRRCRRRRSPSVMSRNTQWSALPAGPRR